MSLRSFSFVVVLSFTSSNSAEMLSREQLACCASILLAFASIVRFGYRIPLRQSHCFSSSVVPVLLSAFQRLLFLQFLPQSGATRRHRFDEQWSGFRASWSNSGYSAATRISGVRDSRSQKRTRSSVGRVIVVSSTNLRTIGQSLSRCVFARTKSSIPSFVNKFASSIVVRCSHRNRNPRCSFQPLIFVITSNRISEHFRMVSNESESHAHDRESPVFGGTAIHFAWSSSSWPNLADRIVLRFGENDDVAVPTKLGRAVEHARLTAHKQVPNPVA